MRFKHSKKRSTIRTAKCFTNRIERDHRGIKQRIRVMQTFQVFRNAQSMIGGIELAHQFRKGKRRRRLNKQGRVVSVNPWMVLPAG
ncbi:MAG: DDE-type integrase/transposase/recombinase [Acidobacteria bacterium]|nr:DDE-type integrase/transposase/recombinase [Acidobacteriota bacterium]